MRWVTMFVLLAGCAATSPGVVTASGPSVESVTQEARVCGDVQSLHPGDWIQFRRRTCAPINAKNVVLRCTDEDIDRGQVVTLADARCAIVRLPAGVAIRSGDSWAPTTGQMAVAH